MTRALSFMILGLAGPALAQSGTPKNDQPTPVNVPEAKPAPPGPPARPVTWSFKIPTEIGFNTGFDGQPGDVTVSRLAAEMGVGIPIATMAQLDLGFEYEYSRYDFSNATGFVAGTSSPFQDVHREIFRARFGQQETMQLSWLVGGYIGLSAEDGAKSGDSVVGGAYGGVAYNVSQSVKIGAAVGVFSRLEDDPLVIPIPTIDWEIDQEWRLSTAGKPGLTLFYTPSDQWTLSLGAWYDERNFRLDENGPIPGGVARDTGMPMQFGVTFRATPNLSLDLGAGVRFVGNYEVINSSGTSIADIDADPAGFVSVGLVVKF